MTNSAIEATRLLVVSRDSAILRPIWSAGESNGWELELAADPWEAIDRAKSGESFDALVLDLPRGSTEGLQSLRWLRRFRPELPIILIGDVDDYGKRQEGICMGAREYLSRPVNDSQLKTAIQSSVSRAADDLDLELTSEDVEWVSEEGVFIGISPSMRKLRAQVALLAESNVPVLILGEEGSGKETIARLIHNLSVRSGFAFEKVNCAALPEDLLERELFGSRSEGTASAARIRIGKLEPSAKGTIFLNEIAEMSGSLQAHLMRMLENRRLMRSSNSDLNEMEVRIVAATSKNIESTISASQPGEELYHRLCTYTIHVPPLRERKEELNLLSRHFMHRLAKQYGLPQREFSPALVAAWQSYHWPGNLRELEQRVKRYLMVGDEELASGMPLLIPDREPARTHSPARESASYASPLLNLTPAAVSGSKSLRSLVKSARAETERNAIAHALEKTRWNRKAAARLLGVSYRTVLYKIEQYRLSAPDPPAFSRANDGRDEGPGLRIHSAAKAPHREFKFEKLANGGR